MATKTIESWRVELVDHEGAIKVYHFATEALAKLAVEWSFEVRLLELTGIEHTKQLWEKSPTAAYCRKISWAQPCLGSPGYVTWRKEYFSYQHEVISRTIIGEAA